MTEEKRVDRRGFLRSGAIGLGGGIAGLLIGSKIGKADPPSEMVIDDDWIQLLSQGSDPVGSTDYAGRMWRSSSGYIKFTIDGLTAEFLEKQSNKGILNGYASLDASILVPAAQEGTGVADSTKYLRGDRSWQVLPALPTFATPAILLGSAAAGGSASTIIRSDATIAAFDAIAPSISAVGDVAAVGTIAFAARRDHVHGREFFATPTILLGSAPAAGLATTLIRSDSTIAAFDATNPTVSAVGDAVAVGSINFAARRDHRHGRESFATPSILLGSAAAAGVGTSLIRNDATIAAFDAIAPTVSAVGDVAAVGSIAFAARRDHLHGREAFAIPGNSAVGDSASAGVATTIPRSDHKHGREAFATPSILLAAAAAAGVGTSLIRNDATIAAFDATLPAASAVGDAGAVGVINFAARRDHIHGREAFAVPIKTTPTLLSAAGVATTISRSDHAHQSPGGVSSIVADVAIANTETAVITFTPGASFLIVGSVIRIKGMGIFTTGATPGSVVFNVRCGVNATTGTVASTKTIAAAANQSAVGFYFEATLIVRTTGASGTCIAEIIAESQVGFTAPIVQISTTAATAVIDTTSASTIISLSMISGNAGSTYTWKVASIEVVKM